MARVATHLSVSELEREYRVAKEAPAARHYQAIWSLAKGHTMPEVAEMTSFGTRWLEQLLSHPTAWLRPAGNVVFRTMPRTR